MTLNIFTVFDQAAGRFLDPFVAATVEVAIREFRRVVNQPGHQFHEFPQDYCLYHSGEFNPEDGTILAYPHPHSLGVAHTFLQRAPSQDALSAAFDGVSGDA